MPADNPFAAAFPFCHLFSERACDGLTPRCLLSERRLDRARHPGDLLRMLLKKHLATNRTFFAQRLPNTRRWGFFQRAQPPFTELHPFCSAPVALPTPAYAPVTLTHTCPCASSTSFAPWRVRMASVMLRSNPYRPDPGDPVLVNEELFWIGHCPYCRVVYWTEKCLGPANVAPVAAVPEPAVGEDVTTTELRRLLEGEGVGTDGGIYLSSEGGWRQRPSSN